MEYVKVDEFDIAHMCSKMKEYIDAIEFHPDCIVGILEGGYIPARNLAKILAITDMYTIKIKKYDDDGNKMNNEAEIVELITADIIDRRVLIVDDVCETGESLNLAIKEVKKYTETVMGCVLVAKDNFADIKIDGEFCPFTKTFKVGTWIRFYWENGY